MEWEFVVALVVMIPILMLPIGFVWYLNVAGLVHALKEKRAEKREKAEVIL